ncbi:hypothetical protein RCG23_13440 [Neobacillus sp. PS3-34]|uniref:hypothetical protein n=1 Tax=Neobacillus sp. PS3-34 TaxID=3070678 RepID=UPI0027DF5259|nr:hypothetical protein [Neobacillus sp. PS3-34]WML46654.1 hypothetical protein RCG23_13440 [Neobacillus sp. PS3-34]
MKTEIPASGAENGHHKVDEDRNACHKYLSPQTVQLMSLIGQNLPGKAGKCPSSILLITKTLSWRRKLASISPVEDKTSQLKLEIVSKKLY